MGSTALRRFVNDKDGVECLHGAASPFCIKITASTPVASPTPAVLGGTSMKSVNGSVKSGLDSSQEDFDETADGTSLFPRWIGYSP